MPGIFGFFDYTKPGKGVDKDEPQKHAFFRFWELYIRKFWKFIPLNLISFILLLPIVFVAYMMLYGFIINLTKLDFQEYISPFFQVIGGMAAMIPEFLHIPLLIISLVFYGPFLAGITYIFRNYVREEHAWFSDLYERAIKNFKQALFFGLLDVFIFILLMVNLTYPAELTQGVSQFVSVIMTVAKYLSVLLAVLYLFMRNYFYIQVVTFDLSIRAIIKNAWIFSILGIFRNMLALFLTVLFWIITVFANPIIELIFVPLIVFSFIGFMNIFIVYPVVNKYLIEPLEPKKEEASEEYDGDDNAELTEWDGKYDLDTEDDEASEKDSAREDK